MITLQCQLEFLFVCRFSTRNASCEKVSIRKELEFILILENIKSNPIFLLGLLIRIKSISKIFMQIKSISKSNIREISLCLFRHQIIIIIFEF